MGLRIFDLPVSHSIVTGVSRQYKMEQLSHIYEMLTDNRFDVWTHARTLVIGNRDEQYEFFAQRCRTNHCILDLARLGYR